MSYFHIYLLMFSRLNLSNLTFPCITDDSERVDKQAKLTQIVWHKIPIDLDFLTKVSVVLFIKVALEDFLQCPQQYTLYMDGGTPPKRPSLELPPCKWVAAQFPHQPGPPGAGGAAGTGQSEETVYYHHETGTFPPPAPPPAAWLLSSGAGNHTTSTLTRDKGLLKPLLK